jgi:molybdopterin-guanine dinucleotide biosynthesis protein A
MMTVTIAPQDRVGQEMNAYLLIGGRSRRMGQSKVELFLPGTIAAARGAFEALYAVQRRGGEPAAGIETLFEPSHAEEAPAFGVLRALEHAGGRCFILAIDYPLLTTAVLAWLAERAAASTAALVVPRWGERLQMLCAGFDGAALAPRLAERIAGGRLDLRGLAAEVETEVIEERELRARFPGEPLRNVNTREELQEAMRLR